MASVLPITAIVLLLSITVAPLDSAVLVLFLFGAVLLVGGMGLFTMGVDMSMIPMGEVVGVTMSRSKFFLLPVVGYFLLGVLSTVAEPDLQVLAEQVPAIDNLVLILTVAVLTKQVEEVSNGSISQKAMGRALSIGVCLSVGLAMVRVLTGLNILWLLVPGYAVSLGLSFFVPAIFTGIAFDSGGVASGPMTATFLLPFAMGACSALGGNMMTDAFGIVAMVAMTPLVTIQTMGLYSQIQHALARRRLRYRVDRVEDAVVYFD